MRIRLINEPIQKPNSYRIKSMVREFLEGKVPPNVNPQNPLKPNKVIKPKFPMDFILTKFPNVKKVMTELLTVMFKDYVDNIYVIAPKPTTFKVVLKNKQSFLMIYNERRGEPSYILKVSGKKYDLMNLPERQRAIEAISNLLNTQKFITSKAGDEDEIDKETKSEGPGKEKGSKKSSSGGGGGSPDLGLDTGATKNDKGEDLPDLDALLKGEEEGESAENEAPTDLKEHKIILL